MIDGGEGTIPIPLGEKEEKTSKKRRKPIDSAPGVWYSYKAVSKQPGTLTTKTPLPGRRKIGWEEKGLDKGRRMW